MEPKDPHLTSPYAVEAVVRSACRLADAWRLTMAERGRLFGESRVEMLTRWHHGDVRLHEVSPGVLERMGHVLAVYGALHRMYADHQRADGWVHRPNGAHVFDGQTPRDVLVGGRLSDLAAVRSYVEQAAEGA